MKHGFAAARRGFNLGLCSLLWTSAQAQPNTSQERPLPPLVARYKVQLQTPSQGMQTQVWQLERSDTRIAWTKAQGLEDIWQRDASGIRLTRVMRRQRHLIDYSAGELRTLEVDVDWRELACLFAEQDLAHLAQQAGKPGRYQGRAGREQVQIDWDATARLPIRLVRTGPAGRVQFDRVAMHTQLPAAWPAAGDRTEDFTRLDAADFGDMAYNPVVQLAQARNESAGWRNAHAGHQPNRADTPGRQPHAGLQGEH
jgi:hypothetical protein